MVQKEATQGDALVHELDDSMTLVEMLRPSPALIGILTLRLFTLMI